MSLAIGIGIGLPFGSNVTATNPPQSLLTVAIQGKLRVTAKMNDKALVLEPYALYQTSNGGVALNAVVIYGEGKRFRKFKPQDFDISKLTEISVTDDKFFANWAFDVSSINGAQSIIAAVKLIEYGQEGQ